MVALLLLVACQEPFGTDRHDLVGFRIAAMQAVPQGPNVTPVLAMVVDGALYADEPVRLTWHWVSEPGEAAALGPNDPGIAQGAAPMLTIPSDGPKVLAVVAHQGGRTARAVMTLPPPTTVPPAVLTISAEPLELQRSSVTAEQLSLEARKGLSPADGPVEADRFVRLHALTMSGPVVRWMATAGTFFELDRETADWVAADLRVDDDEVVEPRKPFDGDWVTVLALALDGPGSTAFVARDLSLASASDGVWAGGRFLPTDAPIVNAASDRIVGTLARDDESPTGLRLLGATLDASTVVPPLPCGDGGEFHPDWLLQQRCGRNEVDGQRVALQVGGTP